jgi:hypothetical protein
VTVGTIKVPLHCGGHMMGITRVVGVDSKSSAPAPSVRACRDRESPRALLYGGGSVTRIVGPDGSRRPQSVVPAGDRRPGPSSIPVG